ncbi:MAG: hypothetical protein ACR2PY_06310 [Salinispira sp.]
MGKLCPTPGDDTPTSPGGASLRPAPCACLFSSIRRLLVVICLSDATVAETVAG